MKSCRVYFRDRKGVEHAVYIPSAVNRYHAFGIALKELQNCSWSNPASGAVDKMTVQTLEQGGTRITVTREEFETWLGDKEKQPKDRLREWIMMLLGRRAPDREFKKGIQAR